MTKKGKKLNPKEKAFCSYYTEIGGEGCGRPCVAARLSGWGKNAGAKLLNDERIQEYINRLHAARMRKVNLNAEKVLHDLEHTRVLALEKSDLMAAARCSELQGKAMALFADRLAVDSEALHQFDEHRRRQAQRISSIINRNRELSPSNPPLLPASFSADAAMVEANFLPEPQADHTNEENDGETD